MPAHSGRPERSPAKVLGVVMAILTTGLASAQVPYQEPAQAYPQAPPPDYGQAQQQPYQPAYQQPGPTSGLQYPEPRQPSMKELFARTLGAVLQGTATAATLGISQVVVGGINEWFSRRTRPGRTAQGVPAAPDGSGTYPTVHTATTGYETTANAPTAGGYSYPPASQTSMPTPYYDPYTAQSANPAALADAAVYAGLAFEVHALTPEGYSVPVDPANHVFATGDRFVVHLRPSLPGRLDVQNINPAGRESRIDSASMAAGQLTSLGPYQFTDTKGDEWLRFVLWPCSTPQLQTKTRDIVNVAESAYAPAETAGSGLALLGCEAVRTRSLTGIRTRDIRNVAQEGSTSFALDPVSTQELATGQLQPREVTVMFRHR